ncbi:alpha/beta hydrolase [Christiangramia flava]|nr:alpha/beta hydrolase [Christiangramia flava]
MKKLIFLVVAVLCANCFQLSAQEYQRLMDIPYYDSINSVPSDYERQMKLVDISFPEDKNKVPVIIWFHGGGLTGGSKELPDALTGKGYCVVGAGYRLSPKVKAAESVYDAAEAVAWVFRNIEKFHGDPERIFVSGHSAGGYLALMSVMDKDLLVKYDLDANDVAGLVPFSGHTITHFTIRQEMGIPGEQPLIDRWAPIYYVRKDTPPILLITGDREKEMLGRYEENAYFYRMMKVNGQNDIDIYELDGYGHNMTLPAFPLLLNFVSEHSSN